jgi:hypothetical protein
MGALLLLPSFLEDHDQLRHDELVFGPAYL